MAQAAREEPPADDLVPVDDLAWALGVHRRTLFRISRERGIDRVKRPLDRRTWLSESAIRQALDEPQRRPQRKARPGEQLRDPASGRFAEGG